MIKNIISDIGNVLAYFRWKELMGDLGFSQETIHRLQKNMIYHPLWEEFDRGSLADEEVIRQFKKENPGLEEQIDLFFGHTEDLICQYDYTVPWLTSLKEKGYNLYYLSNYPRLLFENHKKTRFSFLPLMEGGVVSYEEKLIKPDPAIYYRLYEKYGLKPEECIFMDDREENVEAAKKTGMYGIVFESYEASAIKIENYVKSNKDSAIKQ